MPTITLMHGLPGSGKSYTAKRKQAWICSADDFFMVNGEYKFDPKKLGQAHQTCKEKVAALMRESKDIVVDNTNLTAQECKPYIEMALKNGYNCVIEEPQTTWKYNVEECAKRNTHGVPIQKIEAMKNKMESVSVIWAKLHKESVLA